MDVVGQEKDEAELGQLGRLEADMQNAHPAVRVGHFGHGEAKDQEQVRNPQKAEDEEPVFVKRDLDRDHEEEQEDSAQGPAHLVDEEEEGLAVIECGQGARGVEDHQHPDRHENQGDEEERLVEAAAPDHFHCQAFLSAAAKRRTSALNVSPRTSKLANMSQLVQAGARRTTSPGAAAAAARSTTSA